MPCVFCKQTDPTTLIHKNGIPILKCTNCEHVYARPIADHIDNIYNDAYFFGGNDGYPNYLEERALLERRGRRYARLLRKYTEPGRMLDIGSAAGFILNGFQDSGWTGTGIEPNFGMAQHGASELGLDIRHGTLEDHDFAVNSFDLVTMIQVVAHIADPLRTFQTIASILKPGGLLLIETWNQESLTARLMRHHWHEYSPPSVLHWFTPARLTRELSRMGMSPVAHGRMLKWLSLRHAVSLVAHIVGSQRLAAAAARAPSMALPYPSEDLFWLVGAKG